jgi:hypothetical protein
VQQQALSCWMSGAYRPKGSRNVTRLAEKLGVEIYQRLGLPSPEPALDAKVLELAQALMAIPAEARTQVRQALMAALAAALRSGASQQPEQVLRIFAGELQQGAGRRASGEDGAP